MKKTKRQVLLHTSLVLIFLASQALAGTTISVDFLGRISSNTDNQGRLDQTAVAGVVPVNGYLVANNSSAILYVSDVGIANVGGASIPIPAGAVFMTPSGYKPAGAVSLYGGAAGQAFAARRW